MKMRMNITEESNSFLFLVKKAALEKEFNLLVDDGMQIIIAMEFDGKKSNETNQNEI